MNKEEKIELPNDEKAEKFLLNYTAATDWKEIEKLSWTSAECFELLRLAFTHADQENKELRGEIDSVKELLKEWKKFLPKGTPSERIWQSFIDDLEQALKTKEDEG